MSAMLYVVDEKPDQPHAERAESMPGDLFTNQLMARHGRSVTSFLMRLTGGQWHTTEDLAQETMIRAWQHRRSIPEDEGAQRRWLFTTARRLLIDMLRRQKHRPKEAGDLALEKMLVDSDPLYFAIANISLAESFGSLSADHREILYEIYINGRAAETLAIDLDLPVGTVKSRAHYAMRALRAALRISDL
jgi:RNA polymerase sigma-70 factor (ECF subfamily)